MIKDTVEKAREPNLNLKEYLSGAYIHPVFKDDDKNDKEQEFENILVPTKRISRLNTPIASNTYSTEIIPQP